MDKHHASCCLTHGVPRRLSDPNPLVQARVDEITFLRERVATLERLILQLAAVAATSGRVQ